MKVAVIIFSAVILFAASGHARVEHPVGEVSVEDTVRFQIGGKLYRLDISLSDSITVIRSSHYQYEGEVYREYRFIVHNRHSRAHGHFGTPTLDSIYGAWLADEGNRQFYENYLQRCDSGHSGRIDLVVADFNDYWIFLAEYGGDYYLNDSWVFHPSFRIADSIVTWRNMDGLYPFQIVEAAALSDDRGILMQYNNGEKTVIELIDKKKEVYCLDGQNFIAPARAIHNFEIIQRTNNTGNLIPS